MSEEQQNQNETAAEDQVEVPEEAQSEQQVVEDVAEGPQERPEIQFKMSKDSWAALAQFAQMIRSDGENFFQLLDVLGQSQEVVIKVDE